MTGVPREELYSQYCVRRYMMMHGTGTWYLADLATASRGGGGGGMNRGAVRGSGIKVFFRKKKDLLGERSHYPLRRGITHCCASTK